MSYLISATDMLQILRTPGPRSSWRQRLTAAGQAVLILGGAVAGLMVLGLDRLP